MQRRTRLAPSRPQIVICKCRSHCTIYNPTTGRYEGNGQPQSRPTRDNHARNDRLLSSTIANSSTYAAPAQTPAFPSSALAPWVRQAVAECEILMNLPLSHPGRPLVFLNPPQVNGAFVWPSADVVVHPNTGLYALSNARANQAFLSVAFRMRALLLDATHHSRRNPQSQQLASLVIQLSNNMHQLMRLREVEWSQQRGASGVDVPYVNTGEDLSSCIPPELGHGDSILNHLPELYFQSMVSSNGLQSASSILSLVLENIFFIPRRALRTLLAGSRGLLRQHRATNEDIAAIQIDPTSGLLRARLNPVTKQFVVCPSCHALYPFLPGDNPRNQDNPFILNCDNQRTSASPVCGTMLWKEKSLGNGQSLLLPVRKYVHQDLKSWVGRLLSRPGMEDMLDSCWEPAAPPSSPRSNVPDIWSSRVFETLKDSTGAPFYPGPNGEGRLVFSLSVDSFNPFHNKTAKQSVSSTGIWMVLLNLPQHLRYLHENMYVAGIIPGPDKPSKEDIYAYIELVMKDLLEFWCPGFRFSRTAKEALGRLFKAILVPLVCDMLGARQGS